MHSKMIMNRMQQQHVATIPIPKQLNHVEHKHQFGNPNQTFQLQQRQLLLQMANDARQRETLQHHSNNKSFLLATNRSANLSSHSVNSDKFLELAIKEFRDKHGYKMISKMLNTTKNTELATVANQQKYHQAQQQHQQQQQQQQHTVRNNYKQEQLQVSKRSKDNTGCTKRDTRITSLNADKWDFNFNELIKFRNVHGHCLVPNGWNENKRLAHWVKRQRYQYKLKQDDEKSKITEEKDQNQNRTVMTDSRQEALEKLGFEWDAHAARWEERFHELCQYNKIFGTCNVRSTCTYSPRLADWVKSQRRQYRNFVRGKPSKLTKQKVSKLDLLGFIWNPKGLSL